jgi:hypothetical protein
MSRARHAPRWSFSRRTAATVCAASVVLSAGCGSTQRDAHTGLAPASSVVVSASIDDRAVSISPRRLGAGPITLVITNQSSTAQQVTLETAADPGGGPGERAVQTGPISPRETASVNADVKTGTYALHVAGDDVRAARLVVGRPRPSAQNDLVQP